MSRTTLTLEADVAHLLQEEAHRLRKSFKQVVNDVLRRGLTGMGTAEPSKPYRVTPHDAKLRSGIDRFSLNRLADELEDEALLAKPGERR